MTNPIANPDQFDAEEAVRAMLALPEAAAARAHCAQLWRVGHGTDVPREVEPHFDTAMDGWIANYLFKAAAMDPFNPRFVRNFMPGYNWRGAAVPDARMGADNPDNCYRLAGIRHGCRYRVTGQVQDVRPAHISFTLVENWGTSVTAQTLELPGIEVDEEGRFTLTIDETPANGRTNHMTTNPRVKFLFVRDSMMDWARETPLSLAIERLEGGPVHSIGLEERLAEAMRRAREEVPLYYWFFRLSAGRAINSLSPPMRVAGVGGLVTQASAIGRLHLEEDQAAVIRFARASAAYCSLQLAMWWYRSIDAHEMQTGLNLAQAQSDADGWTTMVVSAQDPGVANWVQTGGFRDLLPIIRWQGLPQGEGGQEPMQEMSVVPLAEVEHHLSREILRLDPSARAAQLAARRAGWQRRVEA